MDLLKAIFGGGGGNAVNATEAKTKLDNENPPLVLDVRQPDEFRAGHIAGAKHIPLNELNNRLKELPKDRAILCVCFSGSRSGVAVGQLTRAGYQAINLRGGMSGWNAAGLPIKKGK